MNLKSGVYEQLINKSLRRELKSLPDAIVRTEKLDGAESPVILAKYLCEVLRGALADIDCSDDDTKARIDFANKIISAIAKESGAEDFSSLELDVPAEELTACIKSENSIYALYPNNEIPRPKTSLAESSLFTGSEKEPPLFSELKAEIKSCDRIDMLVSFIKWSGLRLIIDELEKFTQNGGRLRVITTSYMGATDAKAVEKLASLPNTEIMISYNTASTRLHAKAYLFARDTGFTTSYIGSSNISKAALSSGLEWNLKVTQKDMPQTIKKVSATFESYWNSPDFTKYSKSDKGKLEEALAYERTRGNSSSLQGCNFDIIPYSYQKEILDKVEAERAIHGRYRNLIVAATGTGKTVISAFDYKRYLRENPLSPCRLLFVAHREEILEQSISCFRGVLKDQNFGELFVGSYRPDSLEHLFISVQSFNSADMTSKTSADYYDFIVVDEFHHAAAPTYKKLLDYYKPQILLGLTATPERMDGQSVLEYFGGRIAAEIRLPEAIERKLLSPFQYFGVTDDVDLTSLRWTRGGYDRSELSNLYTMSRAVAENRAVHIALSVEKYVTDIGAVKGLGFCVSVEHAKFMSDFFNSCSVPSISLHGGSSESERDEAKKKLVTGEIKFIFVVDLYNEGVDIPEINTVLFLRPTESLTVFLQQLGRGLRLAEDKECLTVLDFIGHANKRYNFEDKFAALLSNTDKNVEKEIKEGFASLPKGCFIQLEKRATEFVLENIRSSLSNIPELVRRIASFEEDFAVPLNLANFINALKIDVRRIYLRESNFARLCVKAGKRENFAEDAEVTLKRAFARICSINSLAWIKFLQRFFDNPAPTDINDMTQNEKRMLLMFHYTIWHKLPEECGFADAAESLETLKLCPVMLHELTELLAYLADKIDFVGRQIDLGYDCPLELHCSYTKDQILLAFDHKNPASVREGVKYLPDKKTDLLWMTLNKSAKDYSPSTMYDDYSINAELFHWQSQSTTAETSVMGQRYISHANTGNKILLFVREYKKDAAETAPYTYMGPVQYLKHEGSKPMNVTWKLENEIPAKYLKKTNKLGVA